MFSKLIPCVVLSSPVESVNNVGVWFDTDFSLFKHVENVCKNCFVQLINFRHFSRFLTPDASVLVANALVDRRLDCCNSFFRSLSSVLYIQNSATRIVSNTSRYTSITPVLKKLHWITDEHCTVFKTATLVYKFLHTDIRKYFAPYLSSNHTSHSIRHSQSGGNFLVIPKLYPSIHKSVNNL